MTAATLAATGTIAQFAHSVRGVDMPAPVRHETRRSLLNILGCTIGGSRHRAVEALWRGTAPFAGAPQATLIGRGQRTDTLSAALINTFASSVNTFDDTHAEAIIHPAGPIMGAVLAVAERQPVSGAACLDAFAIGIEIACRLSKALSVTPAEGVIAWSQTGICSGPAAAAAAGRLIGLDPSGLERAIGIAASQASGIRRLHGSMCTAMMPAHASHTGLRAAYLAEAGFTATAGAVEGRYGMAECFASSAHLPHLTEALGERWEVLANTYKPFPCGIVINPLIDAALQLRRAHGLDGRFIARVDVRASPGALALCNRPQPKDEMEAQVSLHHWTAVAFLRGRAGVADGLDAVIADPYIAALRQRVSPVADPSIPIDGCDMTVTLADGRRLEQRVRDCIGSRGNPMSDRDLEAKFAALADGVLPKDRAARLVEATWGIDGLADAALLARLAA